MFPTHGRQTTVIDGSRLDDNALGLVVKCLERGGLVAFPTDTVYGLAASALLPEAITALYEAKGRPEHKPLPILVPSIESLCRIVSAVPARARELAARYWPGPLTLVLPKADTIPDIVTAGRPTVGVRMPDHVVALQILRRCPFPVAVTSANISGQAAPVTAQQVLEQLEGRIDLLVDAGRCPGGVPSTVIDLTQDPPAVLRQGPIVLEL